MTTVLIDGLGRHELNAITYEFSGPDAPRAVPNGNFAMAALLPLAMSRGAELHFSGRVDATFLANLEEYMIAWCRWRPDLFRIVSLSADEEATIAPAVQRGTMMAFSGGLDSNFALYAHKAGLMGRRTRDIEAGVLIQGFDIPLENSRAFDIARTHVAAILEAHGVRLNIVRTNWQKPFCVKWGMTHVLGIASVLHQFDQGFAGGLIADDFSYDVQWMPWSNNTLTNPMLRAHNFDFSSTGAGWFRTEKAAALASSASVLEHLRVCYERPDLGGNCGACEKCLRTKINFYAAGVRTMPSLQPPLTEAQVRSLPELSRDALCWYVDALANGTWAAEDPVHRALADIVRINSQRLGVTAGLDKAREPSLAKKIRNRLRTALRHVKSAILRNDGFRGTGRSGTKKG